MTIQPSTPIEIQNQLVQNLKIEDIDASVSVRNLSYGWIKLQVITTQFEGKSQVEREQKVDDLLEPVGFNLGQYPVSDYSLLTPDESLEQPTENPQLPLWSDILMAPEPLNEAHAEKEMPERPQIVTFYSFKGGVGRSTALGIVATLLAQRNRKVVMIDFDLEAPGISVLFNSDNNNIENRCGVLDYVHQRLLTPHENIPSIEDCIQQVELPGRGELFLVSAGEYNESYIHRLAQLDRGTWQAFYKRQKNPISQLLDDIKGYIDPDVILIDARPGFNDTGAVALLDLADIGVICFTPTDQSFDGLRWVIRAARKQSEYLGKPDLRFLLTPIPPLSKEQLRNWVSKTEDWITDHWELPNDANVEELYYMVSYNPQIAALSHLVDVPESLTSAYARIVDVIDASLPDSINISHLATPSSRASILDELQFEAATAQELQAESIPVIFQRTGDFPKFLRKNTWLIRGAKGTGKSILFRLFSELPDKAMELSSNEVDLKDHYFIAGHGQPKLSPSILDGQNLNSFEQEVGENFWAVFWLNYALLRLLINLRKHYPDLSTLLNLDNKLVQLISTERLTQSDIITWLVERVQSPRATPQAVDELRSIDHWLNEEKINIWLLYDELDVGFGTGSESYARRRRALEALLSWWLESGTALKSIVPKIFLREDIWTKLNFVNKGHYTGRSIQLKWEEVDLWKLVLRQSLQSSESLSRVLSQDLGLTLDSLEMAGLEQLHKGLYPLWGERMGRGRKAYTYNWIRTRIADTNSNCFPRSLILLLQTAVTKEKTFSNEYSSEIVLRPRSLIDSFPYVSEQRVNEVRNEYPELSDFLERMESERSPIDENKLARIWNMSEEKVSLTIKDMVEAGILKERSRPQDPPPRIYRVAELYLYGLKMVRKGQR